MTVHRLTQNFGSGFVPLSIGSGRGMFKTRPIDGVVRLSLDQSPGPPGQSGMVDRVGVVAKKEPTPQHLDMVFVLGRYSLKFIPRSQFVAILIVALDAVQLFEKIRVFDKIDPIVVVGTVANVPEQIAEGITSFEPRIVPSFEITLHVVGNARTAGMELCEHFRLCPEAMDVPADGRTVLHAQAIPVIPAILFAEARRAAAIGGGAGELSQMANKVEVFFHVRKQGPDKLGFHGARTIAIFRCDRQTSQNLRPHRRHISSRSSCRQVKNAVNLRLHEMPWQSPQDETEARGELLAECIRKAPTLRQALALTVSHVGEAIDTAIDQGRHEEAYRADRAAFCQMMHDSEDDLEDDGVRGWRLAWRVAREAFQIYERAPLMTEEDLLANIFAAGPYEAGKEKVPKEIYIRDFFAGATELIHAWAQRFAW